MYFCQIILDKCAFYSVCITKPAYQISFLYPTVPSAGELTSKMERLGFSHIQQQQMGLTSLEPQDYDMDPYRQGLTPPQMPGDHMHPYGKDVSHAAVKPLSRVIQVVVNSTLYLCNWSVSPHNKWSHIRCVYFFPGSNHKNAA